MKRLLKKRWPLLVMLVFVASLVGVLASHIGDRPAKPATVASNQGVKTTPSNQAQTLDQPQFNNKLHSTDDPTSVWVIVNKHRPLNPKTYAPDVTVPNIPLRLSASSGEMHVSTQMAPSLEKMVAAAKTAGLSLMLASGYRSYDLQVSVYGAEVKNYGQATADRESARPGFSEHQTGLAADLEPASRQCEVADCFADTPEGKWLAANAADYGFVIRYPQNQEAVTGYKYEPWHVRYVGTDLAQEIKKRGYPTLETFFNLGPAPDYL